MIDPLGRISIQSEDVFPMAVLFITIPDLLGKDLDVAVQQLSNLGLTLVVAEVLLADPEDAIVDSLAPPPGQQVEAGTQILITPTDRPLVPVPDVRNQPLADAKATLEAVGLIPEEAFVALFDPSTAVVDFTEPAQGTPVRVGTTIVIFPRDAP
jgi:serine/threonine-protein kinase